MCLNGIGGKVRLSHIWNPLQLHKGGKAGKNLSNMKSDVSKWSGRSKVFTNKEAITIAERWNARKNLNNMKSDVSKWDWEK